MASKARRQGASAAAISTIDERLEELRTAQFVAKQEPIFHPVADSPAVPAAPAVYYRIAIVIGTLLLMRQNPA